MPSKILDGLNQKQSHAVSHKDGPLLIIAGAGTGKTTVITRRIAWLIEQKLSRTDEILALTFTDKAASSMQEKVDVLVPYGYLDIWISTFHAFGDRLLRENALELGLNPDFKVLTRPEAAVFFREHIFEFDLSYYRPLSDPTRFIEALLDIFSRLKDEDISQEEYLRYAQSLRNKAKEKPDDEALLEEAVKTKEIAACYVKFQQLLLREGKVDFGNQFYLALELLRRHPSVLKRYQKQFKYILVDEFQDTNFAQFQLLKLLSGGHKNITCVADDDQCIARGALIAVPEGQKKIEDIKKGDSVLTAVGKGHIGISKVNNVFKKRSKVRLLTFQTENGSKVTVTSNHKMFCYVPARPIRKPAKIYYVYLMYRSDLGWRLGVTNDLAVRLKLERSADKIIGLRYFKTEQEAQYFETYLSLKYGIPTVCFAKRKGLYLVDEWLLKLYRELNTEERVKHLARDLDVNLDFHHYCLDAVSRGNKVRIKINIYLCYRKYISKERKDKLLQNPSILHRLTLDTSDEKTIDKLKKSGFGLHRTKKGARLNYCSSDIRKVEDAASSLRELTGGIMEYKFNLGKLNIENLPALVIPASNVLLGHYLPVRKGYSIIYDRIVDIKEEECIETVYDLEIDRTHNFIANEIVVHNCIYRWRGAAYSNIFNFIKEYPSSGKIALIQNYRSTQAILDSAYNLIQHNNPERFEVKSNIDKRLISDREGSKAIECLYFDTLSSEADNVAKIIQDKIKSGNYKYSDFAILVRANNDAQPFLRSLNMLGLPWRFSGNKGLYSHEEVRLCISFLRIMNNIEDSLGLYYLATSSIYKLTALELAPATHLARRRNYSLFFVLENLNNEPELSQFISAEAKEKIEKLILDVKKFLSSSRNLTTGRLLYQFLTDTGYLKGLVGQPSLANEEKILNLAKFFDIVRNFENIAKEDRVEYFVHHLDMLIEAGDDPATSEADMDIDAVAVLTIHKAKGLEFNVVFMVSLVNGKFPWPSRRQPIELPDELIKDILPSGDFHIQEERRLFYVGMTRAKNELYFTCGYDYGGSRRRRVSQFVLEALGKKEDDFKIKKSSGLETIERFAPVAQGQIALSKGKPKQEGERISLSYYQIDDYLTCPLKYKYVHILRVPIMEHHTVLYGKALHDAIQKYFRYKMKDIEIGVEQLVDSFLAAFKQEGFLDVRHKEKKTSIAIEALKRFFREQEEIKKMPTYIEKDFSFLLGSSRIVGRWDRIDIDDKSSYIIDFKSSEVTKQKDADKKAKESLQLSIYGLAFKHLFDKLPDYVELHFLESGLKGRHEVSEKDLDRAVDAIEEAASGIRLANFSAKPAYLACTYCAYSQICPSSVASI